MNYNVRERPQWRMQISIWALTAWNSDLDTSLIQVVLVPRGCTGWDECIPWFTWCIHFKSFRMPSMNGWVEFLWPLPDRNSVVFRWWWVRKLWQQSGDWPGMEILTLWKVHEDDQVIDSLIAGSLTLCRFNAFNFRGHTSWSGAFRKFGLLALEIQ